MNKPFTPRPNLLPEGVALRPIPEWEADYAAGSDGVIYSLKYLGCIPLVPWFYGREGRRYPAVRLRGKGGRKKQAGVHQFVALAFHGQPSDPSFEVRHKDGTTTNTLPDNLVWGTTEENMADRLAHGTSNQGERNGQSKLTEAVVKEIRRRADLDNQQAAKFFNVSDTLIRMVRLGKRWAHVDGPLGSVQPHPVSAETRAKMSAARLGRKHSAETRAKLSAAAKRRYAVTSLPSE